MYVSGWDDNDQPIWADDGEASGGGMDTSILPTYSVQDPVAYANTEPDMYGESASSGDGTIAERAVKTENLAGDVIHTLPDGSKYGQTPDGNYYKITDAQYKAMDAAINHGDVSGITKDTMASLRGSPVTPSGSVIDKITGGLKSYFTDANGKTDWAKLATAAAGIKAITGGDKVKTGGWKGSIPMDTQAIRGRIDYNDPNRRPGSMGRSYFTDMAYASPANAAAARAGVTEQAKGILSAYKPTPAPQPTTQPAPMETLPSSGASGVSSLMPIPQATGMARGGIAQPRYLQGMTDGMADKIPSSIDGQQKAALSHGEFVIPADVVSHFGNGNSDAGAKKLYDMMARIRKARTGTTQQGRRINPDSFMPGGRVGYASGGIARFAGPDGSAVGVTGTGSTGTTGTSAASTTAPGLGSSTESSLSEWAGPYVSDYLSKGAAVADTPYEGYKGPLVADSSELQKKQFSGLSNLADNNTFNASAAQQYMNPYIQAALNPQLDEMRRQAQITQMTNAGKLSQAGAYGGSRQAIMDAETQRNLMMEQNKALAQGYSTAFDKAAGIFGTDKSRDLQVQQELGRAGETQRNIDQQGMTADKLQFEEERDYPGKMVQYQKDLLQGLPITTTSNSLNQTQISELSAQIQGLMGLYKTLSGLGQAPAATTPATTPAKT